MTLRFVAALCLAATSFADTPKFREHLIAADLKGGYQVVASDVNGDGRPDLIALASGMTELVWFENPTWTRHVIAGNLSRMINLAVHDIEGDRIPEIALAHKFENLAANSIGIVSILRSQNGDPKLPWSVQEIDRLTTSHRLRWADVDGSGKKVLVNAPLTGAMAAAPDYQDAAPLVIYRPGAWKRELVNQDNRGVVHGIFIHDWNRDRRDDILTASFLGIHAHALSPKGVWQRTEIAKGSSEPWPKGGSSDIAIGALGKNSFLAAIEPWHGNQVSVYTKRGNDWHRELIDDTLVDGHTIAVADLDGDKQDEIIAGFRGQGRSVYVYSFKGKRWTRTVLDDGGIAAAACTVADLNSDRRPDIACIGSHTANLKWYENVK